MTDELTNLSFRTLFDATVEAKLLVDAAGRIVLANPAAQLLFGYNEDEICEVMVEMLIPARYREKHRRYRALFLDNPKKRTMGDGKALAALCRDGKEILLDINLSPIKTQGQFYVLAGFNVTDQRLKAEEALLASEERLRLAKQAAGLGIFDCDCKNKIIYWDEKMRELWGSSNETMSYKEFLATIHPQDRAARQVAFESAIDTTGHEGFKAEYRIINPANGVERWRWISSIGQVHFKDGRADRLVGVVRDVTEQKNLQKKLQAQRNETENLFKQQVAVRTASAIAHELNQPLTAISAYSEVALHALHQEAFNTDNLKKALEGCVEQAQRAGRSIHELLAFLQKSETETEQLNLNDLIQEALGIARNDGFGGFHQVLSLQENLPAAQGNRLQVQKVLVNLFRNAVEAMRIANVPTSKISVSVQTLAETNMALVVVQDNGSGLDKDMVKYIFDPFFTTKPSGIGMGLSISRALIEANGGQLWLDPDSKAGAKFHFTLPLAL